MAGKVGMIVGLTVKVETSKTGGGLAITARVGVDEDGLLPLAGTCPQAVKKITISNR